ncbi:MAG: hypothetical protein ABIJ96_14815 [Elusimicrobiota bacterium]
MKKLLFLCLASSLFLGVPSPGSAVTNAVPDIGAGNAVEPEGYEENDLSQSLFSACGPMGVLCPTRRTGTLNVLPEGAPAINGFSDLGPAGVKGDIDGPMSRGNGGYQVRKNEDYLLSVALKTGYMDFVFTLKRVRETGADTVNIVGRMWKQDKWIDVDGTNDVTVAYDVKKDTGRLSWVERGQKKSERFWRGENRDGRMTIEFGGGYDHEFKRGK